MAIAFGGILTLLSLFGFLREGFRLSTLLMLVVGLLAIAWVLVPRTARIRFLLPCTAAALLVLLPFACPAPARAMTHDLRVLARNTAVDRYLTLSETVRGYQAANPGDLRIIEALAAGAEQVGRTDEAFSLRLSALNAGDDRAASWRRVCGDAEKTGGMAALVPALMTRYAAHPADPETNRWLGDAYEAAGRQLDAMYHWSIAVREDPQDARAHFSLAKGFLALGSLDACDASLQAAFETAADPALLAEIRSMQDRLLRQMMLMREVSDE